MQPFKYIYGGVSGGVGPQGGANSTLSASPFLAWSSLKDNELKPSSWEGGFANVTGEIDAYAGVGGSLSASYFTSNKKVWEGFSFDIGIGLGGGGGLAKSAGYTYYKHTELFVTKTKLMSSARLTAKWTEFCTLGIFPGTIVSDGIEATNKGWDKTKQDMKKWVEEWPDFW